MIEMKVMGIALDVRTNSPIVVLNDLENRKALPIWIGSAEASAIIRCIEGLVVARPMTHDLVTNIIEKTGYKLDKIEINDVEKETYYATLFLSKGDETLEIDARPSDAIAHGEYDTKTWFKDASYKLDFPHNQTGNFSFLDGHVESIAKSVYDPIHLWRLSLSY